MVGLHGSHNGAGLTSTVQNNPVHPRGESSVASGLVEMHLLVQRKNGRSHQCDSARRVCRDRSGHQRFEKSKTDSQIQDQWKPRSGFYR